MEIQILDISEDSAFDANAEKAKGTAGVLIKGGQGELAYDFAPLVAQCIAAGLPYGFYWVVDARFHSTDHFSAIQKAFPTGFGQLGLWLDWEKPLTTMTDAQYSALPYAGYKDCSGLIVLLKAWTNQLKGIYTSIGFWDLLSVPHGDVTNQGTAEWFANQCDLWEAEYGVTTPVKIGAWANYTLWQFQESPDYSTFNGTQDEFNSYFSLASSPVVSAPVTQVTQVTPSQSVTLPIYTFTPTADGTYTLKVTP